MFNPCILHYGSTLFSSAIIELVAEDLTGLVRKYLPPGNVFEVFQFYSSWCTAHVVEPVASIFGEETLRDFLVHFLGGG